MSSEIATMLENLDTVYRLYHQNILESIDEYIYKEERYENHFSVALIYSKKSLTSHVKELEKMIRKTDKLTFITDNVIFIVFDAIQVNNCVKAAENLYKTLKSVEYHQDYFIATAFSEEFRENYLIMINHLFYRLHYSVEHNCESDINDEDYLI